MDVHNKLVFSILNYFEQDKKRGTLEDVSIGKLEGALNVLEDVYKVSRSDENDIKKYAMPTNLFDIFSGSINEPSMNIKEESDKDIEVGAPEKVAISNLKENERTNVFVFGEQGISTHLKTKVSKETLNSDDKQDPSLSVTLKKKEENSVEQYLSGKHPSDQNINNALKLLGFEKPESASKCIKAAIQKKYIVLKNDTDLDVANVFTGKCYMCDSEMSCSFRDLLHQSDYGGGDYDNGCQDGALHCPDEECGEGAYVTGFCEGRPQLDNGKSHNHCTECKGFGQCIGDYREAHCEKCNGHYFMGGQDFPCPRCSRGRNEGRGSKGRKRGRGGKRGKNENDDECRLM